MAGWLADPRGPRREGPASRTQEPPPDPPRRRRGRPPRPGTESRLLHRSPPPLQESRRGDGKRLRAASRGFKDNNKKMATTQLLLRTPSPKVPQCPGGVEAEEWRATPRAGRGVRADLHAPPAKDTTRRAEGDAENPPAPGEPAPPPPALTGCLVCGYILLRSRIIQTDLVGCAGQRRAAHWL